MDKKYTRRYNYSTILGVPHREPKFWWKLFDSLGHVLKRLVFELHNIFGSRRPLEARDYEEAKRLASERVSEKEYLWRFTSINPYCKNGWRHILGWIRENITYD